MNSFNLENYDPVSDRITEFYERYPKGRILTKIISSIEHIQKHVVMQAAVWKDEKNYHDGKKPDCIGHAMEIAGQRGANQTAWLENCETSVIGRALANLDIWIKRKGASLQEMEKTNIGQAQAFIKKNGGSTNPDRGKPPARKGTPSVKQYKLLRDKMINIGMDTAEKQSAYVRSKLKKTMLELSWKDVNPLLVEIEKDKVMKEFDQTSTIVPDQAVPMPIDNDRIPF